MDLFRRVYTNNIVIEGQHLTDLQTGATFFIIGQNYVFIDANENIWSISPKSLIINGEKYDAKKINSVAVKDGMSCFFVSKEEVIQRAICYFKDYFFPKDYETISYDLVFRFPQKALFLQYRTFKFSITTLPNIEHSFN